MKQYLKILIPLLIVTNAIMAQDIIVKKDGTILNVYNLEESSTSYFYSITPSTDTKILKISKQEVFSVKKQNGESFKTGNNDRTKKVISINDAVTAIICSDIVNDKKYGRCLSAQTKDGHVLNYRILSETAHTLAVIKGKYHENEYMIPEYVKIGEDTYIVSEIDDKAFNNEGTIKHIQLPTTLKKIGKEAFYRTRLERIVLPEGLEKIEREAFAFVNSSGTIIEIYLPSSIKIIESYAFLFCGKNTSYRGYCQAYFSNMPEFITEGNCKSFGIDEEAVKAFYNKNNR